MTEQTWVPKDIDTGKSATAYTSDLLAGEGRE